MRFYATMGVKRLNHLPRKLEGECVRRDAGHGDRDGRAPRNIGFYPPIGGKRVNHAGFVGFSATTNPHAFSKASYFFFGTK
jgi:hypothetical protein